MHECIKIMNNITINKIWLIDNAIWIRTEDGREACEKFDDYPRLKYATPEQRANYEPTNLVFIGKNLMRI